MEYAEPSGRATTLRKASRSPTVRYRLRQIQANMRPATVFLSGPMSFHLRVNLSPFCWEMLNLTIQTMQPTRIRIATPSRAISKEPIFRPCSVENSRAKN